MQGFFATKLGMITLSVNLLSTKKVDFLQGQGHHVGFKSSKYYRYAQ